jgi:predicted kinase
MAGILASGKTTLATDLARRLEAVHLEADAVRRELEGAGHPEARVPGFSAAVYEELLGRATRVLDADRPVVLDGCFRSRELRARARALAEARGVPFLLVECRVPEPLARARLGQRERATGTPGWLAMLDAFLREWEPVEELPPGAHAVADGAASALEVAAGLEEHLRDPGLAGGGAETRLVR